MRWIILFIFSSLFGYGINNDVNLLCSESFCESYLTKNTCNSLPEACTIQNVTHNGVFFPFPGPCNCCNYCLVNLAQGAACAKGDPTSPQPTAMCGSLLSCQSSAERQICEKMTTPCIETQTKYDEARKDGTLGHLQLCPVCDRNGLYAPFACVPGEICYCISEDGRRIFGEIPYTTQPESILKCKCSRSYDKALQAQNKKERPIQFLRCQSQGDYDTIQCIGQSCLCTDPEDGHPTYADMEPVNMSSISKTTLPCFNSKTHSEHFYYHECESKYIEELNLLRRYEKEGFDIFGHSLPNCQLDGLYAPVQHKENIKYCAAPLGEKLENFEVSISDSLALSMDCKCARARSMIVSEEKPDCCKNGNYKKMQCRRGLCRCVDENGVQVQKEVEYKEREKLPCFILQCV